MKKIFFYIAALAGMIGTPCCEYVPEEEEVYTEYTKEHLIGRWELVAYYSETPYDLDGDGNASTDLLPQLGNCNMWTCCRLHSTLEITDTEFKFYYIGNNPECAQHFEPNGYMTILYPWHLEQNYLIFTISDYQILYEIIKLSNITLIMEDINPPTWDGNKFFVKYRKIK